MSWESFFVRAALALIILWLMKPLMIPQAIKEQEKRRKELLLLIGLAGALLLLIKFVRLYF